MTFMDVLNTDWMGKPLGLWLGFIGLIVFLLLLDLGLLNRKDREIGFRESLIQSGLYITISIAFGIWVWHRFGPMRGEQFFTGYLIEKTLSLDNVFVMSLIFGYVGVPRRLQHRVLFWGILGALILRGIMIAGGAALIHEFEWLLYVFGGFLIVTGLRMILSGGGAPDVAKNPLLGLLQRLFHFTPELQGHHFFIKHPHPRTGTLVNFATPLFLALVLVEGSDVIFAVDSVPAIFLVTNDPYIIYTSNIFAVLGLRALYFAMAAIVHRFHYLKYAISLILIFIGGKIFAVKLLGLHHIPSAVSLGVTIALLLGGILYSLWRTRRFARNWETVQHGGRIYIVRQRN